MTSGFTREVTHTSPFLENNLTPSEPMSSISQQESGIGIDRKEFANQNYAEEKFKETITILLQKFGDRPEFTFKDTIPHENFEEFVQKSPDFQALTSDIRIFNFVILIEKYYIEIYLALSILPKNMYGCSRLSDR